MTTKLQELKDLLHEYNFDHDDADHENLKKAFELFCSMFDMRDAFIYGMMQTVDDQITNHIDDNEDVSEVIDLLTK